MKISGIILTKNEERAIERCIRSMQFCDELLLIDDNSSDRTVELATKLGVKIFTRDLNGDYAGQRNYGLKKAKNEWVLFVDADEIVSDELKREILKIKDQVLIINNYNGFYIRRRDVFLGKEIKHGESGNIKLLRLARKDAGQFKRVVHEYWDIKGKVGDLNGELIHHAHKDLTDFINKISDYSILHAKENEKEGKRSSILRIIFYPMLKFTNNFFVKLAILDGMHGFVTSVVMSFHSFVSWSELWLKQKRITTKR